MHIYRFVINQHAIDAVMIIKTATTLLLLLLLLLLLAETVRMAATAARALHSMMILFWKKIALCL